MLKAEPPTDAQPDVLVDDGSDTGQPFPGSSENPPSNSNGDINPGGDPAVPHGVVLFDNGPLLTTADNGCLTDGFTGDTSVIPAPTNAFGIAGLTGTTRTADNFVVPAGQQWTLSTLTWHAYRTNAPVAEGFTAAVVRIWSTTPVTGGSPLYGDATTNRLISSSFNELYRVAATALADCTRRVKHVEIDMSWVPPLGPGTYWVEVGLTNAGNSVFVPQIVQTGTNNARVLNVACNAWAQGLSGTAANVPYDFPFQLQGSSAELSGSCCLGNGTCTGPSTPSACTGSGGTWSADTNCASACPQACCLSDGTCQTLNATDCGAAGGTWGVGTCGSFLCNDSCGFAPTITDGTHAFSTLEATTDGPTNASGLDCAANVGTNDIWFRYFSPLSATGGTIVFSLCGVPYDTTLHIYESPVCADILSGAQAPLACDDDGCGAVGGGSTIVHSIGPGVVEFLIRVGGWNGASGSGSLLISAIPTSQGACCRLSGTCEIVGPENCGAPDLFREGLPCSLASTCGPVGACCRGVDGCSETSLETCDSLGGFFLGAGATCGAAADCDGDGETNFCTIASGGTNARHDCNGNGIPDGCDLSSGFSDDCQNSGAGDGIPDDCQLHEVDQVHDNGPYITGTGNGFGGANTSIIETCENTFGYNSLSGTFSIADDFAVTEPGGVLLDSITVRAYQTAAATPGGACCPHSFTAMFLSLWDGPPGTPGAKRILGSDMTVNRLRAADTNFAGVYRVTATTLTNDDRAVIDVVGDLTWVSQELAPGTYWVEWALTGSIASGPWSVPIVPHSPTANARQSNGGVFTEVVGLSLDVGQTEPNGVEFAFLINASSAATPSNDCDNDTIPDECDTPCLDCSLPGDLSGDGFVTGADIQEFTDCVIAGPGIGAGCNCSDTNASGTATTEDVAAFVTALLS